MHPTPRLPLRSISASLALIGSGIAHGQLSEDSINAAYRYSASGAGVGMIVWERGRTRFETYYNGHSAKTPLHIYSGTKSFFGVLSAIAAEEGLIDLNAKVSDTITEWRGDRRKREILIGDLLNFTSGLETGFEEIYGGSKADKLTLSLGLDAKRNRGDAFIYGPGHLQVFCEVLRRKLRASGTSYEKYLDKKLIRPLGISITRWREDAHGNPIASAGMYMTGRDWLKLGQLIAQGGQWRGKQLVSARRLTPCFTGSSINPAFGMGFWLNGYAGRSGARVVDVEEWLDREPLPENWRGACLSESAPRELIVSLGSNFQRLYIVPSKGLVVVHQGKKEGRFRDAEFLRLLFKDAR